MSIQKFRKKPVEIEAMQWDGTAAGATPIIDWALTNGATARYREADSGTTPAGTDWADPGYIVIDTLEGRMSARADDWIIRGVQGEFYPCKPDIFDATYEEVPSEIGSETYRDSWSGNTFAVGDKVDGWDATRGAIVRRIYKKSPKSRWYADVDDNGKSKTVFANDLRKVS